MEQKALRSALLALVRAGQSAQAQKLCRALKVKLDLSGADLSWANLTDAHLTDVKYDGHTS